MTHLATQLAILEERYGIGGFTVEDIDDDDPVLRAANGNTVDRLRAASVIFPAVCREPPGAW